MGHSSTSSRLSLAPWWWEGAGKHSGAARTTSVNQHQTSAEAPAVTSQGLQFGTLPCRTAPNSQLSRVSHSRSCPDPSRLPSSGIGPRKANKHPAALRLPVGRSGAPMGTLLAGQSPALAHPPGASPVAGTISHPSAEPATSCFSLWSQDSGFTGNRGKSKGSGAQARSATSSPRDGRHRSPRSHRSPLPPPSSAPSALLSWSCQQDRPCPRLHRASIHLPTLRPPGIFPDKQDGFVRTSAPPASSSSRLHRRQRGFMITSLFDWFHQPVIISLPKLFQQRRQHRAFGICKDKCPQRHRPAAPRCPWAGPAGPSCSWGQRGPSPSCGNQPHLQAKGLHGLHPRWWGCARCHAGPSETELPQPRSPGVAPGSHQGGRSHLCPASPLLPRPPGSSSGSILGRAGKDPTRGHATSQPWHAGTQLRGFASRQTTPRQQMQCRGVPRPNHPGTPRRSPAPEPRQDPDWHQPPVATAPARPDLKESGSRSPFPSHSW